MVTGAESGIGAAVSRRLAREGSKVGLFGIQPELLRNVAAELEGIRPGSALAVPGDVTDPEHLERAVDEIQDAFGPLTLAVNNAGVSTEPAQVHDVTPEVWRHVFAVNLDGIFHGLKYQAPAMLRAGRGAIVNIASVNAARPMAAQAAYGASKAAVVALTQCAQLDYAHRNIRINVVSPGVTDTPMLAAGGDVAEALEGLVPVGRIAHPDEIASAVVFALSSDASYLLGQHLIVDGGWVLR